MDTAKENDEFNICSSFTLSTDDINCLALLYQPIIGSEALAFYITLNSLIKRSNMESETFNHVFMMDLLGYTLEKIINLRKVLEAIGLVYTYQKDNSYIYLLCPPLSPQKFLSDGFYGVLLCGKIGEENYNNLRNRFKIYKIDKSSYKNISVSFNEMFEPVEKSNTLDDKDLFIDKNDKKKVKFSNYQFDFDSFLNDINQNLIPTGVTNDFKRKIIETASVYSFDAGDMVALFNESINPAQEFDYRLLKKKAKVLYTFKTKNELPDIGLKKINTNNDMLSAIESSTGEELLKSILGSNFKQEDVMKLDELNNTLLLNPSVIKILVMYVVNLIKEKTGVAEMPPISYFKKTADDWILDGITDVDVAYKKYILKVDDESKRTVVRKKRQITKKDKYEIENSNTDIMEGMEVL